MSVVDVLMIDDVAWVTVNNPPVNATSTGMRQGLLDAVAQVQGARLAILKCAGRTFIAGGDMSEFDAPPQAPHLPDVVNAIENSATPFVAIMHGSVLGGGLEVAMACAYRIAAPGTRFGLPEVNVGLVPGAGGTQRAPRLFGWNAAIDMACFGKLLSAKAALALGAINAIESDLEDAARSLTLAPPTPVSQRPVAPLDGDWFLDKRTTLMNRAKGQAAPLHNLDALHWATRPFAEGQPKERALHLSLRTSDESRALRHAFFAERAVAQPSDVSGATPKEIEDIAIVGGGLMGAGIAAACLAAGYRVAIIERDDDAARAAKGRVQSLIAGALKRGTVDQATHDAQIAAFKASAGYDTARGADLAIEAVFEDVEVKKAAFAELAKVMAKDAILATNTSYLDPRDIFEGIDNPARCVGLHFFSPAHIMKLLEVVKLPQTSKDTLATAFSLAKRMRKNAVLSGICDGFIGNRMLAAYRRAAEYMLADGATPKQIDDAMRASGMAMGPFEAQDMGGLQIAEANRRRQDATRPASERYVTISDQLCALGRTGQRAGKGWYAYTGGDRAPKVDPAVTDLITKFSTDHGITRQPYGLDNIQAQLLAVLANEGARIVEEGIADNDAAVDMVKLHGYGFPRWRGGPMFAAKTAGDDAIRVALSALEAQSPGSWVRATRFQ
ncbi:FAD-dependent oxidoreductase [Sedimentitalea todarodis]|uniref:FAD-dependent oxidoreductase n=1 Tax=Sedimentitalea todarodis TaxID=1631240 RepID=A0ABU3VH92_9RHOB|nr:FAD-dependent oxidoreductase [Sedimentitalea todarodis]MDU9005531.1 FAD-dependent oxidoreductase [Sedimentitalea todarodis]